MQCGNGMSILIFILFMKIYANSESNVFHSDGVSNNFTNTNINVSISAVISKHNVNNNTPSIDKTEFENSQDKGESYEASLLSSVFYEYRVESPEDDIQCILERSEFYLSWWINENGTLKIPTSNRSFVPGFLDLSIQFATESSIFNKVLSFTSKHPNEVIRIMSLANNLLSQIPTTVLLLTSSLQYLSLADNNFYRLFEEENTSFENFTTFPLMTSLLELDLRNCYMRGLKSSYFVNLPKLVKLFASHNLFTVIRAEDVMSLQNLQHLDISYNEILPNSLNTGHLYLEEDVFRNLPKLRFLDLSHSLLAYNSSKALKHFGTTLEQLSLCYTGLTFIEKETFFDTNLKVIDLSGNDQLYKNLTPHHFQDLDDSLEIFVFRNANIQSKELFTYLRKLRMLDLRNNEIDSLMPFDFGLLKNLEILDLGNNKISNWKYRLFAENSNIKVVNLRSNNITVIEKEMLKDFYETSFLAIGSNNFICACNLRDFIDRATRNAFYHHCTGRSKRSIYDTSTIPIKDQYNIFLREQLIFSMYYNESFRNILSPLLHKNMKTKSNHTSNQSFNSYSAIESEEKIYDDCDSYDFDQITHMNFNFLLLDFNENDYKCAVKDQESAYSTRYQFTELESCHTEIDTTLAYEGSSDDITTERLEPEDEIDYNDNEISKTNFNDYILYNILLIIPIAIIGGLWYWKRKDINYFLSLFKNSLILSFDADDKKALILANRKKSRNSFDHYSYDVFVSYSDNDRAWVLDELIPNIEKCTDINICLHERDFQVGLSILENIIQCMDKSRCLLLIVSESFLKSNWCAFEMHLAQHRLIETRREQLILVLLHDIPRARRTRTLQYLMRTKTYIMWPNDQKDESKVTFWKRLKKAIIINDKDFEKNKALKKQRHSVV